jgi:hypothetical protein
LIFIYLKWGGIAAAALALVLGGYHFGSLSSKSKLEAVLAAQAENTAKAVLAERAAQETEQKRLQEVLAKYEQTPLDPIVAPLARRVFLYARASECPVPPNGTHSAAVIDPGPQPREDSAIERATSEVFEACARDAAQLNALIDAWPK